MSISSEIDESMMFDNNIDSPVDEDCNSRDNVGGNGPLKKGPWTSGEDAILVEYVTKNGEGNWNAVQKHSGLARCGKSCRLRWTNHLRPNLKKCAFSPEEEQLVIELHSKMGNKWAKMATELPGRTDNEIKNFWNTRIKRLQRAGLPIYPPGIESSKDEPQQSNDTTTTFPSHDAYYQNLIPFDKFEFQTVEFKGLKVDDDAYSTSALLDIPSSSDLIPQGLHSIMLPSNCFRGSDIGQIGQPFVYSSPYDHNSTSDHGSHACLNGNPSSSDPNWSPKMELPSLQTQMGSRWGPPSSSPLCSFESVDIPIQTTPSTENTMPYNNTSPISSGLLDAVLYESQTMNSLFSHASNVGVDLMDTFYNTNMEGYGEQMSSLGRSCSSVFSEGTAISRSSFDDHEYVERGCKIKDEATFVDPMRYGNKGIETTNEMIWSPDMLLADCFSPNPCSYW